MQTLVSQMNVRQRATSAEEDFNNQVDKMTCFCDTSQSIFSRALSSSKRLINKVAMVARMETMFGLSNLDFHQS